MSQRTTARDARAHLESLGVTVTGGTATQVNGRRVIKLDVANLRMDLHELEERAVRAGLRVVSRTDFQRWVDDAAAVIEREERELLNVEMQTRFGRQANITHVADIDPAEVDRLTHSFNLALRERWVAKGIPLDMPDEYFDALR